MYANNENDRDACDGSCGFTCTECHAAAIRDELERCGYFLATWELDLQDGRNIETFYRDVTAQQRSNVRFAARMASFEAPVEPADEVAPLPCDVCNVECLTDLMGIPCCGSRTCTMVIDAEIARDRAEMDRVAAAPADMTPLAILLLASITLKRQERAAAAV